MRRDVHGPPARSSNPPPPVLHYNPPLNGPVPVIHQDQSLIAVCKPSGLLSVPGKSPLHEDCLESRLREQGVSALLVHRLDMDTSGVIVFAANIYSQRHLGLQFERRHIAKHYTAVVQGVITDDCGEVDLPLRTDWDNRPKQMVDRCLGRSATTRWKVLKRTANTTRVMLEPITGRSHQLRVHMAEIGHPIVGDKFYSQLQGQSVRESRLRLHSESISLFHPENGERVTFTCPCPF